MRIVHFSDIHLSAENYHELNNHFSEALIDQLIELNLNKSIDLVIITGDLVDCGGKSLNTIMADEGVSSHFKLFEKLFINPISEKVNINKNKFLFIPGNHDVDEEKINWLSEKRLIKDKIRFIDEKVNGTNFLNENLPDYKNSERIKEFKEFEKEYQKENIRDGNYRFTENQSSFLYECDNKKIGFILINDSWLCKSTLFRGECKRIFFGHQQLYDGLKWLEEEGAKINFCLVHHSVDDYMEGDRVERFLKYKNVSVLFNGHYHKQQFENLSEEKDGYISFRVSAGLLKPDENNEDYKPGFQIVDFDLWANTISGFEYFIYDYDKCRMKTITDQIGLDLSEPIKLPVKQVQEKPEIGDGPDINDVYDL
ncbi:MAG: metallophosphoesterase [Brumimicrobium sp.]